MKYAGFYINLDGSPERRKSIEEELTRNGLGGRYARFAATAGNALNFPNPQELVENEIGCFTSHCRLLMENRGRLQPLHVIEDDIILSRPVETLLDQLIDGGELAKYDIIYTDTFVPLNNQYCNLYSGIYAANVKRDTQGGLESVTFTLFDMHDLNFGSTCSFLVNPESIGKLAALYEDELKRGASGAIDYYIHRLCHNGDIRVGCIFPFITSIRPESCFESTIHDRDAADTYASHMLRHSFYVECDLARSLEQASRIYPPPESCDLHGQLIQRLLGYSLRPVYKKA